MNKLKKLLLLLILIITPFYSSTGLAQSADPSSENIDPIKSAQTAISQRDWAIAEAILHPLTISQPRNPFVFYEMAQVYENTNRIEAARQIYRGLASIPDAAQRQYAIVVRSPKSSYMTSLASLSQAKLNVLSVNYPATSGSVPTASATTTSPVAVQQAITPLSPKRVPQSNEQQEQISINQALQSWARAWVNKDLTSYFAHYVPDFKGDLRLASAWRQQRTRNISNKQSIQLDLSDIKITVVQAGKAHLRFKQTYQSDGFASTKIKTLNMIKRGGEWLIEGESTQ